MVNTEFFGHPCSKGFRNLAAFVLLVIMPSPGLEFQTCAQNADSSAREPSDPLTTEQQQVAGRYKKLEELLLRSAELESAENPARSALLQQAAQLGKQSQLADVLARAASRLDKKQYSQALEDQRTSRENLKRLLELLQSENRGERVREQRDQVRRWIEETDRLLRMQKSLSGRTEGGQEMQQAAGDQNKLSNKAKDIAKELGGNEESKEPKAPKDPKAQENSDAKGDGDSKEPNDGNSGEKSAESSDKRDGDPSNEDSSKKDSTKEGDAKEDDQNQKGDDAKSDKPNSDGEKSQDGKPTTEPQDGKADGKEAGKTEDNKPKDGSKGEDNKNGQSPEKPKSENADGKPSESSPGEPSEPSESESGEPQKGSQGQPQQGKSGKSQQQESGNPQPEPKDPTERARKRIEQAQKKMEEAKKALDEAERKGAVEKQREAEAELRSAIEALEEILRQLREEEIERSLASLETRLRRMLEMQNKVLEETLRLQEITGDQASRQVEIRAGNLAGQERKILEEGRRAFLLLREEGSSTAFPEAMEQVNTDIGNVVDRLAKADIGKLTTTVEQEIVSSLEEMVSALVQVQKDQKEKKQKQQQGQPQQGEPGEQPLVDKLAELRLIRTLQVRINNRTTSLSQMLADPADVVGQAKEADILKEVKGLADRQSSIQQVTREIVIGADK